MERLKPCPFCGGTDVEINHITPGWTDDYWRVGCPDCGAWIECQTEDEARDGWNRRAKDD